MSIDCIIDCIIIQKNVLLLSKPTIIPLILFSR